MNLAPALRAGASAGVRLRAQVHRPAAAAAWPRPAPSVWRPVSSTGQWSRTWVGPMSALAVNGRGGVTPPAFANRPFCRARAASTRRSCRTAAAAERRPPTAPRGVRGRCDRRELLERDAWHFDVDIDTCTCVRCKCAVEQRAGKPLLVAADDHRAARAGVFRVAQYPQGHGFCAPTNMKLAGKVSLATGGGWNGSSG